MKRAFFSTVLLLTLFCQVNAQVVDETSIQVAMNQGMDLEFPFFQELTNVTVVSGGETREGDYLFVCTGRLTWLLDSVQLATMLQQEITDEVESQGGDQQLWQAMMIALNLKLAQIGPFEAGGTAVNIRFRVRLERAGSDWVVTNSLIRETDTNPLSLIDPR